MLRTSLSVRASYSENIFKRAARRDEDPFFRDGTNARKALREFRQRPAIVRYAFIFALGFSVGALVEVFACKTHLYESVMSKKETRRHEFDEFVVDYRRNVEKWQQNDMRRAGSSQSS